MRIGVLADLLALLMLATSAAAPGPAPDNGAMPGGNAPDFTLKGLSGLSYTLSELNKSGKVVVLEWFNPQCPAVEKFRAKSTFMNDTWAAFEGKPVIWLAIDSAAAGEQGSDPKVIAHFSEEHHMAVPVLLDTAGTVGKAYGVKVTPTMLVIAPDGKIAYRGAPDPSPMTEHKPFGPNYVKEAVMAVLAGTAPQVTESKTRGCTIKYAGPKLNPALLKTQRVSRREDF